ncbi:MAG: prepilin-type N-terminal cleavage/methylation domain-containing protein [Candidatus Gracilibacteria bacterium]|jgi:prepilin-type N-terminal cleavage/methylation domain-containing protein
MKDINKQKGFTLIELLLYMTIASIVLFAIMSFSIQIITVNKKSSDMQEIETNLDYIANKITSAVLGANSIDDNDCIFNNDSGKLTLNMADSGKTPTGFYLENEAVYIQEADNEAIKLSSDFIKCSQLGFSKITTPKSPDQVILDLKCEPVNSDLANLQQELKIHTSISLRKW